MMRTRNIYRKKQMEIVLEPDDASVEKQVLITQ